MKNKLYHAQFIVIHECRTITKVYRKQTEKGSHVYRYEHETTARYIISFEKKNDAKNYIAFHKERNRYVLNMIANKECVPGQNYVFFKLLEIDGLL